MNIKDYKDIEKSLKEWEIIDNSIVNCHNLLKGILEKESGKNEDKEETTNKAWFRLVNMNIKDPVKINIVGNNAGIEILNYTIKILEKQKRDVEESLKEKGVTF